MGTGECRRWEKTTEYSLAYEKKKKSMGRKEMMKPLLLKVGVAFAVSLAGYLFCGVRLRLIPWKPRGSFNRTPHRGLKDELDALQSDEVEFTNKVEIPVDGYFSRRFGSGEEGFLLPESGESVPEVSSISRSSLSKEMVTEPSKRTERDMETEIEGLRNQVHLLEERERDLEQQLFEYHGLKEQDGTVRELENRVEINSMAVKFFELKTETLEAHNRRLQEHASNYSRTASRLDSARRKIKLMRKRMRTQNELVNMQHSALQNCLSELKTKEREAYSMEEDDEIRKELNRLQGLEAKVEVLRSTNDTLQQENLQLMMKFDSAESVASASNSEIQEVEFIDNSCSEEVGALKELNKKLKDELEKLQMDPCMDIEELVYLRWINACLRYELRNFQPPQGRTFARDLSKTMSPKSEEKAKELILEYADTPDFDSEYCASSQALTTLTDAGDFDNPMPSLESHHAYSKGRSTKSKFFDKLKRMVLGKNHLERMSSRDKSSVGSNKRSSVSKSGTDAVETGSFSWESFSTSSSTTADRSSSATFSDTGSKYLHSEYHGTTGPGTEAGSESAGSEMSISRTSSETYLGDDHLSAYRLSERSESHNTTTHEARKMLGDFHAKDLAFHGNLSFRPEGNSGRLPNSECSPEKLEILRFAEVLKGPYMPVKVQEKPAYSSF